MKLFLNIIVLLFGVVIGCGITNFGMLNFPLWYLFDSSLIIKAGNTQQDIKLLEMMRKGDVGNAIELVEIELNHNLIALKTAAADDNISESASTSIHKAITVANDYHSKYK